MGQRGNGPAFRHFVAAAVLYAVAVAGGACDRPTPAVAGAKHPTVASLSPAGTDILVAIGAQDHLVSVSNYDLGKPAVAALPAAGDYLTVDWERLAKLRPDVLVVQVREAAAPAGFKGRAAELGIRPVYIHIDDLADISAATTTLGGAVHEPAKAAAAQGAFRAKLAAVARSVAGRPRVRTLVVTDEVGAGAAGPGTFLDEILTIAGGANAAAGEGPGYPGVDREKIIALRPDVVLHLLPDKPERTLEEATRFWASLPDVPAVRDGRVHFLTEPSVMHPGLGVGDVAQLFADKLHPGRASSGPLTGAGTAAAPASRPGAGAERASGSEPGGAPDLGARLFRPRIPELTGIRGGAALVLLAALCPRVWWFCAGGEREALRPPDRSRA